MSNDEADPNLRGWFVRHGLPWNMRTAEELENFGVECVEHLKLFPPELRENLFTEEKPIVKTLASLAWKELGSEEFQFSRTIAFQKNKWNVGGVRGRKRRKKNNNTDGKDEENISDEESLPDDGSFADGFKELADDNSGDEAPEYQENFSDEMRVYLEKCAKHWVKNGHQDNQSRLCLYEAFTEGQCKKADVARYIRRHVYSTRKDPWNGVKRNDNKYKAIYSTIARIDEGVRSGKLNEVVNANPEDRAFILKSKSMTPGARGGQNKRKSPAKGESCD